MKKTLTSREIAAALNLRGATLLKYCRRGLIPYQATLSDQKLFDLDNFKEIKQTVDSLKEKNRNYFKKRSSYVG